jgi:GntR family transcriptional regulator
MAFKNNDRRPLYLRIKEYIEELIKKETYQPGDKLPSENSLAEELGVSRASLREALRVLEEENKIVKHQGIGTFVSEPTPKFKKGIEELISVTKTIENAGFTPGTKNLSVAETIPNGSLHEKIEEGCNNNFKKILRIERIRTADEIPVVYCLDHLITDYISNNFQKNDFEGSLFSFLNNKSNIVINNAVTNIIPVNADEYVAEQLNVSKNTALLLLEQYHYDQKERMVLFSQNYFRSDQFQFKVLRK